jgi:hypothetical protein
MESTVSEGYPCCSAKINIILAGSADSVYLTLDRRAKKPAQLNADWRKLYAKRSLPLGPWSRQEATKATPLTPKLAPKPRSYWMG